MLRFMNLPTALFMSFSLCAVYKITDTLALLKKKKYDSQCPQTSQKALLVTAFTFFNYIFIKYLFICEKYVVIQSMIVYITHLFLYLFSNDFRFLKN